MFKRNEDFNIMLATDSYKTSHWRQYPPGTQTVYSYFESRGGDFNSTVFFGLQYFIKRYLEGVVVTKEKIDEAEAIINAHMGPGMFNRAGWEHILEKHSGRLPVTIKAVPEGSLIPTHNILMSIENTDPACFWLTNYLETMLVQVWYPTTVATLSYHIRDMIKAYLEKTGDLVGLPFKFNDFGYRGVSSQESAALGGVAHLVNFSGSDTMAGIMLAREYYGAAMPGFSIPAAEHSTITSWGKDHEADAFMNMLTQYPEGLVAVVSDSFDIYNACSNLWGKNPLYQAVLKRNGTVVVRPDSGHPPEVVMEVLRRLGDAFGYTINTKGFKVLDPHIRIIQGDGVDYAMTYEILETMYMNDWSADNIAFGCGGALLQKLNRDTQKFAFKAASCTVNGEERDVYKEPITDTGKNSKRGRLKLVRDMASYKTVPHTYTHAEDELKEVFRDGRVLQNYSFDEIRGRTLV